MSSAGEHVFHMSRMRVRANAGKAAGCGGVWAKFCARDGAWGGGEHGNGRPPPSVSIL